MPTNVEVKARVRDMLALRRATQALADGAPVQINQEDIFYHTPTGRFKLRTLGDGSGQLVYYERPDTAHPRASRYRTAPTSDPQAMKKLLGSALRVRGIVRKQRTLYMVGQTRVHLDEVEGLGAFMELEVVLTADQTPVDGQNIARALMGRLGIQPDDLVECAYIDLLEAAER
jgi:predicted adenylyl cyclase CyaB